VKAPKCYVDGGKVVKDAGKRNHCEKELTKDMKILTILFSTSFECIDTFYNILVS